MIVRAAAAAISAGLALAAAACGAPASEARERAPAAAPAAQVTTIDAPALARLVADGRAVLVDVRTPEEFAAGHIAGAINQPLATFDPAKVPQVAGKQTVLYCRSGRRSDEAAQRLLAANGAAMHLGGGILAWQAAGQPVTPPD